MSKTQVKSKKWYEGYLNEKNEAKTLYEQAVEKNDLIIAKKARKLLLNVQSRGMKQRLLKKLYRKFPSLKRGGERLKADG